VLQLRVSHLFILIVWLKLGGNPQRKVKSDTLGKPLFPRPDSGGHAQQDAPRRRLHTAAVAEGVAAAHFRVIVRGWPRKAGGWLPSVDGFLRPPRRRQHCRHQSRPPSWTALRPIPTRPPPSRVATPRGSHALAAAAPWLAGPASVLWTRATYSGSVRASRPGPSTAAIAVQSVVSWAANRKPVFCIFVLQ